MAAISQHSEIIQEVYTAVTWGDEGGGGGVTVTLYRPSVVLYPTHPAQYIITRSVCCHTYDLDGNVAVGLCMESPGTLLNAGQQADPVKAVRHLQVSQGALLLQ